MMPVTAPCCHITWLNSMLGSHPASDQLPHRPTEQEKKSATTMCNAPCTPSYKPCGPHQRRMGIVSVRGFHSPDGHTQYIVATFVVAAFLSFNIKHQGRILLMRCWKVTVSVSWTLQRAVFWFLVCGKNGTISVRDTLNQDIGHL